MVNCIPKALTEKFFERVDDSTTSVLITESEKYDATLCDLIKDNPKVNFTLTTHQPADEGKVWSSVYNQLENVNLILADIYDYDFTNEKFDVIFCVPAFGNRLSVSEKVFVKMLMAISWLFYQQK